jgi:hypothetical protein
MAPRFPLQTEGAHSAEFILSEANGNRSRDSAYFADPTTLKVGTPCKQTVAATTDTPATYTVAAAGVDCQALTIYGGASVSGEGLRVSVITRDAEVNGRLINWGALSPAEQIAGAAALLAKGIVVRI